MWVMHVLHMQGAKGLFFCFLILHIIYFCLLKLSFLIILKEIGKNFEF